MRRLVLLFVLVLPGIAATAIFAYFTLQDWHALQQAYRHFELVARTSHDMPALFVAEARQNIHRTNVFADGVWTLMAAIIAAIGVHGLCVMPRDRSSQ